MKLYLYKVDISKSELKPGEDSRSYNIYMEFDANGNILGCGADECSLLDYKKANIEHILLKQDLTLQQLRDIVKKINTDIPKQIPDNVRAGVLSRFNVQPILPSISNRATVEDIDNALILMPIASILKTGGSFTRDKESKNITQVDTPVGYAVQNSTDSDIVINTKVFKANNVTAVEKAELLSLKKYGINMMGNYLVEGIMDTKRLDPYIGVKLVPKNSESGQKLEEKNMDTNPEYKQLIARCWNNSWVIVDFYNIREGVLPFYKLLAHLIKFKPRVQHATALTKGQLQLLRGQLRSPQAIGIALMQESQNTDRQGTEVIIIASIRSGNEVEGYGVYKLSTSEVGILSPEELFSGVQSKQIYAINCSIDTSNRSVSGKDGFKLSDYVVAISKKQSTDPALAHEKAEFINNRLIVYLEHIKSNYQGVFENSIDARTPELRRLFGVAEYYILDIIRRMEKVEEQEELVENFSKKAEGAIKPASKGKDFLGWLMGTK